MNRQGMLTAPQTRVYTRERRSYYVRTRRYAPRHRALR
jgi:hypothetical protein